VSLRKIEEALKAWSEGREPTLGAFNDAMAEVAAVKGAARGLGQRLREAPWDQEEWDAGLDLMEAIAAEANHGR
jgi:hypothetical protein